MTAQASTVAGVQVDRPHKVLWPEDGLTKRDLACYHRDVAPVMVPHLVGRPVTMQRFPDGIDGDSFYEKKVPGHFPSWVQTAEVETEDGPQRQVVVADQRTLVYLADQACLTPHPWLARAGSLDHPDQLVFDLDPPGDPADGTTAAVDTLRLVRRATRRIGELLAELGLTTYLKTSGSRGYHVVVPLRGEEEFGSVRAFAQACAEHLAARQPGVVTLEQRKGRRGDRVFVDVLRNAYGQTMVAPYAVRGRPGAPVSTPITWRELSRVEPAGYTMASVRRRLAQREDPWSDLRRHAQTLDRARRRWPG